MSAATRDRPVRHRLARPAVPLAPRDRGDRVDRHLVLLRRARQPLRLPRTSRDRERGVGGELWEVHGGGFYHVEKFRVAPHDAARTRCTGSSGRPTATWLSGFALFVVLYYLHARTYLIDPSVADLSTGRRSRSASACSRRRGSSTTSSAARSAAQRARARRSHPRPRRARGMGVRRSSSRRARRTSRSARCSGRSWPANVFFVIIPAHWELVRAKEAGRDPDPAANVRGKQRSVHNNYLTLPVLFAMLAGHFPFTYGHAHAWPILVCLMVIGAWVRLYFNLRHAGRTLWGFPVTAAAAIAVLAFWIRPASTPAAERRAGRVRAGRSRSSSSAARSATRSTRRARSSRPRRRGSASTRREQIAAQAAAIKTVVGRLADHAAREPDAHDRRRSATLLGAWIGQGAKIPLMLEIAAGGFDFVARFEEEDAPQTVAAFRRLLPLESRIIHVRWSGEGGLDPVRRPRRSGSARRTRRATRTRASSSSTPAASARPRSCSPTATSASRRKAGPLAGQPLRDDRRGQREPARARTALPLGGRAGDRLHARR